MKIGVPKEIKNHEYRVGIVPSVAHELIAWGHQVLVETNAGSGIGFYDDDYIAVGASILPTADEIYAQADMIVKVKEPQSVERCKLRQGQILFTYLHLAPDFPQTEELIKSKAICIAYETVTDSMGRLPLLAPMSEVAGRMAVQAGAQILERSHHGKGILLGGVPGVAPAKVVIIGGGVVGANAARIAVGMRAKVTILDTNPTTLRTLDSEFQGRVELLYASNANVFEQVTNADLVIGAVLIPGAAAPKIVTRDMIKKMTPGSGVVDVAIDQGGCIETSHATTHDDPTFLVDDIVHYCVANMPGAVARTATYALNNATLPHILAIANKGVVKALQDDANLANGLNVCEGKITNKAVAEAFGMEFVPPLQALSDH